MKMKPRCVPCLINRVLFEADLVTDDEEKKSMVMKEIVKRMASIYSSSKGSAEVATEIHSLAYKLLNNPDPYRDLKERSNSMALKILPKVERMIEESNDALRTAILCSIAGNSIDFGIAGSASSPEELAGKFGEYIRMGIQHDDLDKMRKYLKGEVMYFTDNCGEIVFDRTVCRILKENYDIHLTLVCKKYPVLTDATYQDVKSLGFDEVVDEIMTTGNFAVGVDFNGITEKLRERLHNASLIISKGMANYEAFSETDFKPIVYLLRVKCKSIAEDMNLPQGINAVKVYE